MRGRLPALKVVEGGIAKAAPCPSHLPKAVRKEWDIVTADLSSRGLLNHAILGSVQAYCMAHWKVIQCTKTVEADGAFIKTAKGEPKEHPAFKEMSKAIELVARLAGELGLTPASRQRKGLGGNPKGEGDEGAPAGLDI